MHHNPGFKLTDLIAAAVACAIILSIVLTTPGCGGGGGASTSNKTEAANRLRKVHSAFIMLAQNNKDFYAGIDGKTGDLVPGGETPAKRFSMLLAAKKVEPADLISPIESGRTPAAGDTATTANFSFALLRIDQDDSRRQEWRSTMNSRAVVGSDRNTGTGAGKDARSIAGGEGWAGVVVRNDNHCVWETANPLQFTMYNLKGETSPDDLFADDKNPAGDAGADAAMVYQDATTYVNQK